MALELVDALLNMLEVLRVKGEPWGELEVDCAKLSSRSQRLDRFPKAGPKLGTNLLRHVLVVDVLLVDGSERFADILRQHRGRGLVTGEQAKRLDVEEEVGRRTFRPEARDLGTRHRVVAAVHFDDRELSSVIAKPRLRALCFSRVEAARVDEALVSPGRGADADVEHFLGLDQRPTILRHTQGGIAFGSIHSPRFAALAASSSSQ